MAAPILVATAGSAAADPVFSIDAALSGPDGTQFVIGSDIAPPPPPSFTIAAGRITWALPAQPSP
jgi:hypothetical protein